MAHQILIADDEPHIRDVIAFSLERAGMQVHTARNGSEAMQRMRRGSIDLMVLDIGMPEMDGLAVCREVRKSSDVPILFLTARNEEVDRVLGLELGGDDYVTKPFSPRELVARVGAILRRTRATPRVTEKTHGALKVDPNAHLATYDGHDLDLTALELSILSALIQRPGVVYSRDKLIDAAYGPNMHVAGRTIDSHIRNIRAKLKAMGGNAIIETVHSVGFKLADLP